MQTKLSRLNPALALPASEIDSIVRLTVVMGLATWRELSRAICAWQGKYGACG
jgi:hypothetical protein